jgi:nitric oxide synthase oxygenase domain/subunit
LASGEHRYLNNDNAAVELSPAATENLRIDGGSVGDHLHISSTSAEEKEDEED